jgi:LuxR family maltose regulon positive regulatory protein
MMPRRRVRRRHIRASNDVLAQRPGAAAILAEADQAVRLRNFMLQVSEVAAVDQEIAAGLFLSLHTVQAHVRNIHARLDVNSRTQAVATGRALGLESHAPPRRLS